MKLKEVIQSLAGKWRLVFNAYPHSLFKVTLTVSSFMTALIIAGDSAEIFAAGSSPQSELSQDYAAFYVAGNMAATGMAEGVYNPSRFRSFIGEQSTLSWFYPPPLLLILLPFGLLSFSAVKALLIASSALAAVAMFWRAAGRNWVIGVMGAISPVGYIALIVGQISAIFSLLAVAGFLNVRSRPIFAGVCFGLLTVKPQYGLLVIPFLLLLRAYKVFLAAALTAALLTGLSLAAFGPETWTAFFHSITAGELAAFYQSGGHIGRITALDSANILGIDWLSPLVVYPLLISMGIGGQILLLQQNASLERICAFSLIASAAVAPYFFIYDYFMPAAGAILIMSAAPTTRRRATWPCILLWLSPWLVIKGDLIFVPVLWCVLVVAAVSIVPPGSSRMRHQASVRPFAPQP